MGGRGAIFVGACGRLKMVRRRKARVEQQPPLAVPEELGDSGGDPSSNDLALSSENAVTFK
jgi:hypothetical protein